MNEKVSVDNAANPNVWVSDLLNCLLLGCLNVKPTLHSRIIVTSLHCHLTFI